MKPSVERLLTRHGVLVTVLAAAAAIVRLPAAGGVLLGGGVIGLSLLLYAATLRALVVGGPSRLAIGLLFAKLAALLTLGWLAFSGLPYRPDPMGFALGVSCLPAAAVWEALRVRRT